MAKWGEIKCPRCEELEAKLSESEAMEMEKDTHAFLFELRVRGMLARMFSLRRVEPSEMEMQILTGVTDATVRDMAEIAYRLGFEIDLLPIEPMPPCNDGE